MKLNLPRDQDNGRSIVTKQNYPLSTIKLMVEKFEYYYFGTKQLNLI